MAKGALYWRLKDEKTGKWSYKKLQPYEMEYIGDGMFNVSVPVDVQGEE